jgi:hypothetical protein
MLAPRKVIAASKALSRLLPLFQHPCGVVVTEKKLSNKPKAEPS